MAGVPENASPVVKVDGVGDVVARFTTNGLCEAEAAGGQSLEQMAAEMRAGRASMAAVRSIFRSLLAHAVPDMSAGDAGRVMQEMGADAVSDVINGAFSVYRAGMASAITIPEADPQGRVAFEVGGVRYVLAFHFNALAEMDAVFPGMTMPQIAETMLSGGASLYRVRSMFRAALFDHAEVTLTHAGELIDRIGLATVSEAIGKAFIAAFPKVAPVPDDAGDHSPGNRQQRRAAGKGSADPTKRPRKAGTGTA